MLNIAVLEMGGTINGLLTPDQPASEHSLVVAYLERLPDLSVHAEIITLKDSRAITAEDRRALVEAIRSSGINRILVPHGTRTMTETGEFLLDSLDDMLEETTVVLVGSLIPLDQPNSDAPQNIQIALDALESNSPGVHISMSGRLWHPLEVEKDLNSGVFVPRQTS